MRKVKKHGGQTAACIYRLSVYSLNDQYTGALPDTAITKHITNVSKTISTPSVELTFTARSQSICSFTVEINGFNAYLNKTNAPTP